VPGTQTAGHACPGRTVQEEALFAKGSARERSSCVRVGRPRCIAGQKYVADGSGNDTSLDSAPPRR
jgi:hypothetical protein